MLRSHVFGVVVSQSKDINVTDNVIIGVKTRVQPPNARAQTQDTVAGLYVGALKHPQGSDKCYNLRITNNTIADSHDYCAIVPGQYGPTAPTIVLNTINEPDNKIVEHNTVHTCFTGWLTIADHTWSNNHALSENGNLTANYITAYRTRGLAAGSLAQARHVNFGNLITFDNARSVSISLFERNIDATFLQSSLHDSCIIGEYISTKTGDTSCPATCTGADTENDFYCQESVGFMSTGFNRYEPRKVWPLDSAHFFILWWKGNKVQLREGRFWGQNVMFLNWVGTNRCGKTMTTLITNRHHKSQQPAHFFEDAKFVNVKNENLFYMVGYNASLLAENEMCGGLMVCTGNLNALFKFQNAVTTTTGQTYTDVIPVGTTRQTTGNTRTFQVIPNNVGVSPYIMAPSAYPCTLVSGWNAYQCEDDEGTIGHILFSSTKWDRFITNAIPVTISRKVTDGTLGVVFPDNTDATWPNGFVNTVN